MIFLLYGSLEEFIFYDYQVIITNYYITIIISLTARYESLLWDFSLLEFRITLLPLFYIIINNVIIFTYCKAYVIMIINNQIVEHHYQNYPNKDYCFSLKY